MKGSEIIVEALRMEKVDVVFGYPGGALIPLFDTLMDATDIRFILPRHEQGGGHMADGYARNYLLPQRKAAPVTDKTSSVEPAQEVFHFAGESEAMQKAHARLSAQGIETHVVSSTDPLAPAKRATTG